MRGLLDVVGRSKTEPVRSGYEGCCKRVRLAVRGARVRPRCGRQDLARYARVTRPATDSVTRIPPPESQPGQTRPATHPSLRSLHLPPLQLQHLAATLQTDPSLLQPPHPASSFRILSKPPLPVSLTLARPGCLLAAESRGRPPRAVKPRLSRST